MKEITLQRWQEAQVVEASYWQQITVDNVEMLRITHEKVGAMQWAQRNIEQILGMEGPFVEVGIGPLGVGCIHFLPKSVSHNRELVGIDPLPRTEINDALMPESIRSLIQACHSENYRHMTGIGENVELSSNSVALVVCYNVLDHCHSPKKVVKETWRILKPGGRLILGCDVYSWAGLMKYRIRKAAAMALGIQLNTVGDVAHPHQFLAGDLESLLTRAGLGIVATNARPYERLRRIWSHAYRMLIVARKPGRVE